MVAFKPMGSPHSKPLYLAKNRKQLSGFRAQVFGLDF